MLTLYFQMLSCKKNDEIAWLEKKSALDVREEEENVRRRDVSGFKKKTAPFYNKCRFFVIKKLIIY